MAGRFKLITDEQWSKAHRRAIQDAGWDVVRVVDVLHQGDEDPTILAYCAEHGRVWITSDEKAQGHVAAWLGAGRTLPGIIFVPQRHDIGPGRFVRFLEKLASEEVALRRHDPLPDRRRELRRRFVQST